jgi:hypothetical protein
MKTIQEGKMKFHHRVLLVFCFLLLLSPAFGREQIISFTLASDKVTLSYAPIEFTIPGNNSPWRSVRLKENGRYIPCQLLHLPGHPLKAIWIASSLKKDKLHHYVMTLSDRNAASKDVCKAIPVDKGASVLFDGQLFLTYDVISDPLKPCFYPIMGPCQIYMTRRYPAENIERESRDHLHHRGMWFAHGAVDGMDFWTEPRRGGQYIRASGISDLFSGPVCAGFVAHAVWEASPGKPILDDTRVVQTCMLPIGRLIDIRITLKALNKPVLMGESKEGTFGLRIPDSMTITKGDGHILNSNGVTDRAAWGKKADWVDYTGSVEGRMEGIAMVDMLDSFRHPTWWHVRDYGLFAADSFGGHDLDSSETKGAGDYTIPAGKSITFHYRILFQDGALSDSSIREVCEGYLYSPDVKITAEQSGR